MNTDPRTEPVTARILFIGVMLSCINKNGHYEVGIIQCPEHVDPKITIRGLKSDVVINEDDLSWPEGHDLMFKVVNPVEDSVSPYPSGDAETDFKRVVDLEEPRLYKDGIVVNTDLLNGKRLGVTAGKLYAHRLTDDDVNLVTWEEPEDAGVLALENFGQIADQVGLNILCNKDGRIDILDAETGETLRSIEALPEMSYEIEVNNDCFREEDEPIFQPDAEPSLNVTDAEAGMPTPDPDPDPQIVGTDFRFYYSVIDTKGAPKFDFTINIGANEMPAPSPDICNVTFAGNTKTLGLK
jgi:hypothetical protein